LLYSTTGLLDYVQISRRLYEDQSTEELFQRAKELGGARSIPLIFGTWGGGDSPPPIS
jgi:hypothetical protein